MGTRLNKCWWRFNYHKTVSPFPLPSFFLLALEHQDPIIAHSVERIEILILGESSALLLSVRLFFGGGGEEGGGVCKSTEMGFLAGGAMNWER